MAARKPARLAAVGSLDWVANERGAVHQLEEQDVEDFAFSARADLEWLNEHMAEIFERNSFDMAELLKTPGRLRGKTPRTARKLLLPPEDREPLADIFGSNQPPTATPSAGSKLLDALKQSARKEPPQSPEKPQKADPESPVRSPRKQPSPRKVEDVPVAPPVVEDSPRIEKNVRHSFADSGIFTASQPNSQFTQSLNEKRFSLRTSGSSQAFMDAPSGVPEQEPEKESNAQQSLHGVDESVPEAPWPSPRKEKVAVGRPLENLEQSETTRVSPASPRASPKKAKATTAEPRRSGRLVKEASPEKEVHVSSPLKQELQPEPVASSTVQEVAEEAPYPTLSEPVSSADAPAAEAVSSAEPMPAAEVPLEEDSAGRSSSESPTPEVPPVRKSSLNFASLPAREPLTNKKKSLGNKTARDSHLEQLRQNGANRASWMNRKGNGKSLGGSSKSIVPPENLPDDESALRETDAETSRGLKRKSTLDADAWAKKQKDQDDAEPEMEAEVRVVEEKETVKIPTKSGDDSDGETRRNRDMHSKSSTQRLHDKIQQLGKLSAPRTARSFPAPASQPSSVSSQRPDLPDADDSQSATNTDRPSGEDLPHSTPPAEKPPAEKPSAEDDEEDWIPSRPHLVRSQTENPSPSRREVDSPKILARSPSAKKLDKPQWSSPPAKRQHNAVSPSSPLRTVAYPSVDDVLTTNLELDPFTPTPTRSNPSLSALKGYTSQTFKKAKDIFTKSSAVSASAKAEFLSPPLRSRSGEESLHERSVKDSSPRREKAESAATQDELYPSLESVQGAPKTVADVVIEDTPVSPVGLKEERRTESSHSRFTAVNDVPDQIAPAPASPPVEDYQSEGSGPRVGTNERSTTEPMSPTMAKKAEEAEYRKAKELRRKQQEETLRQEKEELRRKQEELQRRQEQREQEKRRKAQEKTAVESETEELPEPEPQQSQSQSRASSAEPERPPSRLQKMSRFHKTATDNKRPVRPNEKQPKAKPAPVPIKMTTASQKELQDQRNKAHAMPSAQSLVSALKSSFESQSSQASQSNLHASNSSTSMRSTSNTGPSKQLKSLQAAANQRQKEQEDKERKAAQKRELERRRQENQKKAEEEKKQQQQQQQAQAQKGGRTTPGPSAPAKTLNRAQPVPNLRQRSEEPEGKRPDHHQAASVHGKAPPPPVKGPMKRLPTEPVEEPVASRQVPARAGAAAYQQEGNKKRRTNEFDERAPYQMAPPIRNSVAKKELAAPHKGSSTLPYGYSNAAAAAAAAGPSTVKATPAPSALKSAKLPQSNVPQVEGVKYSTDKIKFASSAAGPSNFKTPVTKPLKSAKKPAKDSPVYQNGELIDLPEIPTDSEDDDDDYYGDDDNKNDFAVPQWAESPELRALLRQQQTIDPEEVFGPMQKLDMDAIFENGSERQTARFRARSSSANWSGADRLTAAEIEADLEARKKLMEQGKWTYSAM